MENKEKSCHRTMTSGSSKISHFQFFNTKEFKYIAVWTKLILQKCKKPLPHCQLVSWVVAVYFCLVEVHSASAKEGKSMNVQFQKMSLIHHRRVWNYTTYTFTLSRSVTSKQCQLQSSIGETALHMILSDIVTNALIFL